MEKQDCDYGDPKYWDALYTKTKGETFDWLENYNSLREALINFINPEHAIINLGCGNGKLQEEMYDEGYQNITNVDISQIVIEQMIARPESESRPNMKYQTLDVTDMSSIADKSFDIALDKGTLDCLLCGDT